MLGMFYLTTEGQCRDLSFLVFLAGLALSMKDDISPILKNNEGKGHTES